jgi:lipopolysaccharide export system permease protein
MGTIDRYLLRQFFKTFVICYVSLTGLVIVVDAFTNLDGFIRAAEETGNLYSLLVSFYSFRTLMFFDRTAGLLALVSAMFTVAWLQRHNEMTALQAAGLSRIRIVTPLIVAAAIISVFSAANREIVIPRFRDQLARRPQDPVGARAQDLQPRYDDRTDIFFQGKATYRNGKRIEKPNLLLPTELRRDGKHVRAENAYYRSPQEGRPGGYLFEGVTEPKEIDSLPALRLADGTVVMYTRRDAPDWLKRDECFVVSELTFDQLTGGEAFRQFSSTGELIGALHNSSLGYGADVRVAVHTRVVNPLMDITLFFLGLPLVVSHTNRNVFVAIGLCTAVTTVFLLVVIGFQHLGSMGLVTPALAAWAPLVISIPVAVGLSESMWK